MKSSLQAQWQDVLALHRQHNGFVVLQHYYDRHFTPVGKALFLLLLISLSLGMIGTDILIYLFLSALASLWVACSLVGWWFRPQKLNIQIKWPRELYAGQNYQLEIYVQNLDSKPVFYTGIEANFTRASQSKSQCLQLVEAFFCLGPQEGQSFQLKWTPSRRGLYHFKSLEAISYFPLGFLLWRKRFNYSQEICVYPPLLELTEQPWIQRPPYLSFHHQQSTLLKGSSQEFHSIRPWLPGDSPRSIYWPALARNGQLSVREYQELTGHQLSFVLATEQFKAVSSELFERAISTLATLLLDLQRVPEHDLKRIYLGPEQVFNPNEEDPYLYVLRSLAALTIPAEFDLETILVDLSSQPTSLLICIGIDWSPNLAALETQCLEHSIQFYYLDLAQLLPLAHILEASHYV